MTTADMGQHGIIPTFELPDRLEKARKVRGMSQSQMAEAIDVSRKSISAYEAGTTRPKRHVVLAWAMATGVDGYWLLTGEAPDPNGPGASVLVRHQGLEPRTRWLVVAHQDTADVLDTAA